MNSFDYISVIVIIVEHFDVADVVVVVVNVVVVSAVRKLIGSYIYWQPHQSCTDSPTYYSLTCDHTLLAATPRVGGAGGTGGTADHTQAFKSDSGPVAQVK